MPRRRTQIPFERAFTEEEFERVKVGVVHETMEDHWFICLEGRWLYFVRSWSASCIYKLLLGRGDEKYRVTEAWVSRDPRQYKTEHAARTAILESKTPSAEMYYTLGEVLADGGSYLDAEKNYKLALDANVNPQDKDLHGTILRGLIICANSLNKPGETERWFQVLVAIGKASWWDWSGEGDRLYSQATYDAAEAAYQKSAEAGGGYRQWCLTALTAATINHDDVVLSAGRKCIEEGVGQKDSEPILAGAHQGLAAALNRRGVYSEALSQARESLTLQPDNAFAYDEMADALFGLRRFRETINAAQQAIRLSDGKYAWMHFRLTSAYFELQDWDFARQSFQKSAELNPRMFASIYNVALCYSKLGYYRDAITWYDEYLRRNPNASDRTGVEATIKALKSL